MKRTIFLAVIVVSLFIIYSLIHSIYTLWQKQSLLVRAQKELESEKQENKRIKQNLSLAETPIFIEQEARNKLFLVKPGESSVVLDEKAIASALKKTAEHKVDKSYFQQWLELFF